MPSPAPARSVHELGDPKYDVCQIWKCVTPRKRTIARVTSLTHRVMIKKKRSAVVHFSVSVINITSRYISSTITTSLGGRSIGQCSVELYMRNMVILHCGGPRVDILLFERPSLALKLPLVLYAAAAAYASVYCACSDSTAEKKTKYEGGREADCDHRGDNCVD